MSAPCCPMARCCIKNGATAPTSSHKGKFTSRSPHAMAGCGAQNETARRLFRRAVFLFQSLADAYATFGNHDEICQLVCIFAQYEFKPLSFYAHPFVSQPKQQNSFMRQLLPKDQFAKIAVICNKNAIFRKSDFQNLAVTQRVRIVVCDGG